MSVQTSYGAPAKAIAGQLDTKHGESDILSCVAGEDIPYGRVVEWDATNRVIVLPKSTTLGSIVGISLYPVTNDSTILTGTLTTNAFGYKAGQVVPVLRRGRVNAEVTGTAGTELAAANVAHASTDGSSNLRNRGKLTASATSVTAGAEISATSSSTCPIRFALLHSATPATGLNLVEVKGS